MNNVRPHLRLLTDEQIHDIRQYTLKVLSTTGVRVDSPSALEMLKGRVGDSMVDGRTVRIPAELVEWAIQVARERADRRRLAARHAADGSHAQLTGEVGAPAIGVVVDGATWSNPRSPFVAPGFMRNAIMLPGG